MQTVITGLWAQDNSLLKGSKSFEEQVMRYLRYDGINGNLFKNLPCQACERSVQTIIALTVEQAALCRQTTVQWTNSSKLLQHT
jgi:hypothetical protein